MPIRLLDENLINKIAAGEVVERPAAVVKELVENALDAGATKLLVGLKAGGRNLVRVVDNGCGMNRTDAVLSLERHATSKIRTDADLFQVGTLGFRGEAVPSIASVSRFEMLTCPHGEDVGTRVVVEGGSLKTVENVGCAAGTDIRVASLFYNVPARRKFLRSPETELGHCLEAVTREALIRPELDLTVEHDERSVIRCPSTQTRLQRAQDLLGRDAAALVPVEFERGGLSVHALLSPVGVHRASATNSSYLYVNGRYVRDPILRRAVSSAYSSIVPKDRYPLIVLELRLPPSEVDVNVHPAKVEVRFVHGFAVQDFVASGIRAALSDTGIHRPVAEEARYQPFYRGGEQAELWTVAPETGARDTVHEMQEVAPTVLREEDAGAGAAYEASPSPAPPPNTPPSERYREEISPAPAAAPNERTSPPLRSERSNRPSASIPEIQPANRISALPSGILPRPSRPVVSGPLLPTRRYRDLRIIGQLANTYILCEGGGELLVIDQHAAHERVHLERLERDPKGALGPPQALLNPVLIDLAPAKARALASALEGLNGYGLDVRYLGGNTFAVQSIPPALKREDLHHLLADAADDITMGGHGKSPEERVQRVLATMACHASIRAGQALSLGEMEDLLELLDVVDFGVCAHGRPVVIRLDIAELERRFHRS